MTQYDIIISQNVESGGIQFIERVLSAGKGRILTFDSGNIPVTLAAGTDGYILSRDDSESTGLKWIPSASGIAAFKTWHPASDSGYTWGSSDVVASGTDTMDIIPGTGIAIDTDATSKAIRIRTTGSGGITSAYSSMTDGSVTANASGSDTFKFRSASNKLTLAVTSNDATHGDNVLFTINEGNLSIGWPQITSKPTTLSGYGITDAYTKTNLQTSGQASVHWDNITNTPSTFTPSQHTIASHSATSWRMFYSNATTTTVQELPFGDSGKVLTSNGPSTAPTWETPATGYVTKTGTPQGGDIAVWNTSTQLRSFYGSATPFKYINGVLLLAGTSGTMRLSQTSLEIAVGVFSNVLIKPDTADDGSYAPFYFSTNTTFTSTNLLEVKNNDVTKLSLSSTGHLNISSLGVGSISTTNLRIGTSTTPGYVLTADSLGNASWAESPNSMVYPVTPGIPISTGSAWGTSITNNSANWNTAYGWGNHASAGYVTGTPWTSMGYVTKSGTAADNQIAVWKTNGSIEGNSNLTWTGSLMTVGASGAQNTIKIYGGSSTSASPILSLFRTGIAEVTMGMSGGIFAISRNTSSYSDANLLSSALLTMDGDSIGIEKGFKIKPHAVTSNITLDNEDSYVILNGSDYVYLPPSPADGQVLIIRNNSSSTAAVIFCNGDDIVSQGSVISNFLTLNPNRSMVFIYDSYTSRWAVLSYA
jgi:hypothetical protein